MAYHLTSIAAFQLNHLVYTSVESYKKMLKNKLQLKNKFSLCLTHYTISLNPMIRVTITLPNILVNSINTTYLTGQYHVNYD